MKPRQVRVDGDVAYVTLTKGYEAVIDATDVPLVASFNWCAKPDCNTVYAIRADRSSGKHTTLLMHRELMKADDGIEIDHINGNGLDNRRRNLRFSTKSQNQMNQRLSKANTSGVKGVHFLKSDKKFQAYIKANGKRINLGTHATQEEARLARIAASSALHGDFGRSA